jgi:hypothetical protein
MPTDPTIAILLEIIDCAFNVQSWHGPNLSSSIRGINAKVAAKSMHGRKSIWQQVLHAAYWKQRVLNKIVGTQRFPRSRSNWPRLPETISEEAWKKDCELLEVIHRRLRTAVSKLSSKTLEPKLRKMILGAAAHDLYHAGQINLLKRMLNG